jgi:hypothetical protein
MTKGERIEDVCEGSHHECHQPRYMCEGTVDFHPYSSTESNSLF